MQVQLATTANADEIALMSRDYIEAGLGWSWNKPRVLRAIQDTETIVVVAKHGEKMIAFSIMHFRQSTAHLNLLAVRPTHRRQGVGKRLINWLEESAKTAGTFSLSLELRETNRDALAFYRLLGYQQVEIIERYYQKTESAIRMCKDISEQKIPQH